MNSLIFLDLYWTIQDPFKPTRFRTRYYPLGILVIFIIQVLIMNFFWNFESVFQFNTRSLILSSILISLIFVSLISSLLLCIRLLKKGTSSELKSKVMRRNYLYFIIFILTTIASIYT